MPTPIRSTGRALIGLLLSLATVTAHAGTIAPPELPTPLRSADLRKWKSELKPSDAQRVAIEQAFDACIDAWQRLRDGTVRPAETRLSATPEDDKAIAAWRTTLYRASESMAAEERTMFAAMRAACGDDTQRAEVDRLAASRARRRAAAAIHTLGVNLPRVPDLSKLPEDVRARIDLRQREWELTATPTIERLAGAVLEGADDRERDLARRVLLSQRAAAHDIASLLPKDLAERYLRAFRQRAMPAGSAWTVFEGHTPDSLRARLDPAQHADAMAKLEDWQRKRDELQEQALDALVAAGAPGEMLAALSNEFRALNDQSVRGIAESAGMPELAESSDGVFLTMSDGGEDGGQELGPALALPQGASGAVVMSMSSVQMGDGGNAVLGSTNGSMVSNVVVIRAGDAGDAAPANGSTEIRSATIRVQSSGDDANVALGDPQAISGNANMAAAIGDAVANALSNGAGGGAVVIGGDAAGSNADLPMPMLRRARTLSRQDIDALRTRLAVPDDQRAVWDALAADLLQAEADWMKSGASSPAQDMFPAPGQSADAFLQARNDRRAELARIEDAWFDSVKAAVPGANAARVDAEKSRRALQRALGSVRGGSLLMPDLAMSRTGRMDLDAAVDTLSPAAQAQATASLAAWRASLLQEIAGLQPMLDALARSQFQSMNVGTSDSNDGHSQVSMQLSMDEKQMQAMERARTPIRAAWKRIEQLQQAGLQSVAGALGESDARALRRAVLKQTHPEAFRSQEQVDAALNRVLALPGLSTDQLQAVSALGDQYRQQSDVLVERSIERTDRADVAIHGLFSQQGGDGDPRARFEAMQASERNRSDAGYDREELNARALRRLRASLSPQQAAAAKLD